MNAAELAVRLGGGRPSGNGYSAQCPAHEDHHNSLSFADGDRGLVVTCHAGCPFKDIADALGVPMGEFSPLSRRIVAQYDYRDETGSVLYQTVRYEPKDFRQRRPDGGDGWMWNLDGVRRVVYRLPDLAGHATVYIVEGEKDADRLWSLGIAATCNPMGASTNPDKPKWTDDYSAQLVNAGVRDVVIVPDNDRAGHTHAVAIARSCRAGGLVVRLVSLPGLPPVREKQGEDVSDWLDHGHTVEALAAVVGNARPFGEGADGPTESPAAASEPPEAEPWEPPLPLSPVERAPAFPVNVLPTWICAYVAALSTALQVPPDLPAMLCLSVLAVVVARKVAVRVKDGWTEPLNLFTVTILPPGEGKSPVFAEVIAPLEAWEAAEAERMRPIISDAETQRAIYEARVKKSRELAAKASPVDRANLEAEAKKEARALAAFTVPPAPRLFADDVTPEKLASLLHEQGGRMAVMSAEGGIFELLAGRYSVNGAPNFQVFLQGHSGDTLRVDRITRPADFVKDPALTVGLAVQPAVLSRLHDIPEFRGKGLLARFLYALPTSRLGTRDLDAPAVPDPVRAGYVWRLRELLNLPLPPDDETGPRVTLLPLSPEAKARFREFRGKLEPTLAPDGALDAMKDWAGKLPGHVARIAGLLHIADLADRPDALGGSSYVIPGQTMDRACRLAEKYLVPHARLAFRALGQDPAFAGAERILNWLRSRPRATWGRCTRHECHKALESSFRRVADLAPPLALLIERHYLREQPLNPGRRGRPSVAYLVNPSVYAPQNANDNIDNIDKGDPAPAPSRLFVDSVDIVSRPLAGQMADPEPMVEIEL